MNTHASLMMELTVFIIAVVLTSVVVLLLVQSGVIAVQADGSSEEAPILNAEFIPLGREGILAVKEFQFCRWVDANYNCLEPKENFLLGEEVHFKFVVETSTYNGEVLLVENYRLIAPDGKVILDVDQKNNFNFATQSNRKNEQITFKDYFIAGFELADGEYTLELWLENPLVNKQVKISKTVGLWSYPR